MSYHYASDEDERDPHRLPSIETFFVEAKEFDPESDHTWMGERAQEEMGDESDPERLAEVQADLEGWYWWNCFPGCLPEGEANGPFRSEREALQAARNLWGE